MSDKNILTMKWKEMSSAEQLLLKDKDNKELRERYEILETDYYKLEMKIMEHEDPDTANLLKTQGKGYL